jgi:hypothetical protein
MSPGDGNFVDLDVLKPVVDLLQIDGTQLHRKIVTKPLIASRAAQTCPATFASMNNAMQVLYPFRDRFPIQCKLFASALTFGASTTVSENSFSTLTRMLTPYRRSMMQRRNRQSDGLQFLAKFRGKKQRRRNFPQKVPTSPQIFSTGFKFLPVLIFFPFLFLYILCELKRPLLLERLIEFDFNNQSFVY